MTKELMLRFFKDQCTADEATEVVNYLQQNPGKEDEFLPEQAWNDLPAASLFSPAKEKELLKKVKKELGLKTPQTRKLWIWSAAASILVVCGVALFLKNESPKTPVHKNEVVHTLVNINYGKEVLVLNTADGSTVFLQPGSEIRYPEHFKGINRNFYLKGVARFKVAKDPQRPFRVYADEMVTTALGTDFTVTDKEEDETILIQLHEGRVVIGPKNLKSGPAMKPVYLQAGEELSVHKKSLVSTRAYTTKPSTNIQGNTTISASMITFKNESLENIFSTLEKELPIQIHFKQSDIAGRYFTGSIKPDLQQAENMLREIALLNQLTINLRDHQYTLSKPSTTNNH